MEQSAVSVDVVALKFDGELRFAVTPRRAEPFLGQTALPGVLLGRGETLNDAARRAVVTKLDVGDITATGQLAVFDEPNRDPRGPTLSVAMWAVIGDGGVQWRTLDETSGLAFDHSRIVADARKIMSRMLWRDIPFTRAVLGERFPATSAVAVTAALAGVRPDAGNLNRTMKAIEGLEPTGERQQVRATGRPTVVWEWI